MKYRARRPAAQFDVAVTGEQGECRAKIMNITERGARVHVFGVELEAEDFVALRIRGRTYPAQVVWRIGNEAGVTFASELPPAVLSAVNPRLRRAAAGKKKRFLMPQNRGL